MYKFIGIYKSVNAQMAMVATSHEVVDDHLKNSSLNS